MNKSALIVGSAVVIAGAVAAGMLLRTAGSEPPAATPPAASEVVSAPDAPRIDRPAVESLAPAEVSVPVAPATDKEPPTAAKVESAAPVARVPARRKQPDANPDAPPPVVPVDVARTALAYVGADPAAEEVWAAAINDPSLSAHARQDLIEDLNEDGFPDPKHVTPDDLPLIASRLALIEDLAPDAMDQVNADAFAEAYKDLMNMYGRLTEQ